MCKLCDDTKRQHPAYNFCPYCGKNYNPNGFKPNYIAAIKYDDCYPNGRPKGLGTTSFIRLNK